MIAGGCATPLVASDATTTLRWDLLVAKADPLLWVPDAVAWSWMRGGEWRRAVAPFCQLREL